MHRTFNTVEEAIETWDRENEKALVKSGVLCKCRCYRWEDNIKESRPSQNCTILIPEEVYNDYKKWTTERDKDYRSKAHVAVLNPGDIRVILYPNERDKDNYLVRENLCKRKFKVNDLLGRYLGQKIRLGKNLLVKNSKQK